jgi:cytochrome c peroxidase
MGIKNINIISCLIASTLLLGSFTVEFNQHVSLSYPEFWPMPTYNFSNNPLSEEGIQLGKKLFYDPLLSKDNTISCSSCHLSYTAFTHVDHKLSHGLNDRIGTRNSLALMNLAWNKTFMWDGSANHLDMQALAPISDPNEMGSSIQEVVEKLKSSQEYPPLFTTAFGDESITGSKVLKALSQFQLTLISSNSKYDKVVGDNSEESFTEQEENGYKLYKQHCATCHAEPLFTTGDFANNGLPIDSKLQDLGRMKITQNPLDSMSFRIPSLRNLKYSFPYMHDGRFGNLNEVINHYTEEIDPSGFIDSRLSQKIVLTSNQKVDLIAFLRTLNDEEFVFNKDFAFPQ